VFSITKKNIIVYILRESESAFSLVSAIIVPHLKIRTWTSSCNIFNFVQAKSSIPLENSIDMNEELYMYISWTQHIVIRMWKQLFLYTTILRKRFQHLSSVKNAYEDHLGTTVVDINYIYNYIYISLTHHEGRHETMKI